MKRFYIETAISLISIMFTIFSWLTGLGNVCMPTYAFVLILLVAMAIGWLLGYRQFNITRKKDIASFYGPGMKVMLKTTRQLMRVVKQHPFKRHYIICITDDGKEIVCHSDELMLIV